MVISFVGPYGLGLVAREFAMFKPKITLEKHVYDKVRVAAELSGCTSVDEFVVQLLEREADAVITAKSSNKNVSDAEIDEISQKLKGLGYLE